MGEQKLGECNDVTSDRKKGVAGLRGYVGSEDHAVRRKAVELGQL